MTIAAGVSSCASIAGEEEDTRIALPLHVLCQDMIHGRGLWGTNEAATRQSKSHCTPPRASPDGLELTQRATEFSRLLLILQILLSELKMSQASNPLCLNLLKQAHAWKTAFQFKLEIAAAHHQFKWSGSQTQPMHHHRASLNLRLLARTGAHTRNGTMLFRLHVVQARHLEWATPHTAPRESSERSRPRIGFGRLGENMAEEA